MLAGKRSIRFEGREVERTPLLVPSFSSKGFPSVDEIVKYSSELIDGPSLFSAYDLHYGKISTSIDFPSLIFLDSGGYEAARDSDLSDFGDREHFPQPWNQEMHEAQLKLWNPNVPSAIISYDHPRERLLIKDQIERAQSMAPGRKDVIREILLKPETQSQTLLQMPSILSSIHQLADFDIIGVTEKEIGNSILDRMKNIGKLRMALAKAGLETPIHVFGSLDTVTTPLYFLAGADIFDGLTWLRFAFHDGQTVYKQNHGAVRFGVSTKAHVIDGRCWNDNYHYLRDLELEMRRYLNAYDIGVFKHHRDLFKDAIESTKEALEG